MLRVLLVLLTAFFLAPGPGKESKPKPTQDPLSAITSCEENIPPRECPPHCGC